MKKVSWLAPIALLLAGGGAFGQSSKGDWVVGGGLSGSLGIGSYRVRSGDAAAEPNKTVKAGLNGFAGYFLADGVELGPELDYSFSKETEPDGDSSALTLYDLGVQGGFFHPLGRSLLLYFRSSLPYRALRSRFELGPITGESIGRGLSLMPRGGANLLVTDHLALNVNLFLLLSALWDRETGERTTTLRYGVELGLNLFL